MYILKLKQGRVKQRVLKFFEDSLPNLTLILQNMPNSNCHLYHTLASLSEMPIQLKLAILSTFWLGNDYLKIEMVLYPWQEVL